MEMHAVATIAEKTLDWSQCPELERVPGKVSGAWVFRGTRVPVSAILRNLKDLGVDEVVEEFLSITRAQVLTVVDFIARSADPVASKL